MIKVLLSDFSDVLLFTRVSSYNGSLNALHARQAIKPNYLFFDYFALNQELLEFYQEVKEKNQLKIVMYTSGLVQETPELKQYLDPIFDQVFSAGKVDKPKHERESYVWLAKELAVKTDEILFIDDSELNSEAAGQAGVHAVQYISNEQVMKEVTK